MKVLFEGSIFFHQNYGGISKYISKLNEKLPSHKVNSKIFIPIIINNYLKRKKNIIFFTKINSIPRLFNKIFITINNILTIFYIKFFTPDILHFSYYNDFLLRFLKIPFVLTVYDLIHEKRGYKNNYFRKDKLIKKASHIICISNETKKDLIKYYKVDKKKISIIYLGVDIKKRNTIKKKNYILFVGSRTRYKNFINFVKAFNSSKFLKEKYSILCFGGGKFTFKELTLFKKLGLLKKIKLTEGNDRKLENSFKKASLFVTTSTDEGFGLTPFEAMNFGCPVVCGNLRVFRENLLNCCYFVDVKSITQIKIGIEKVLKNTELKKRLIKNSYKKIKQFTWNKVSLQTLFVYQKVMKLRKNL